MNQLELAQLRIVLLAGTLGQGGAERQLFYTLKAMRDAGMAPHLLCLTTGEYWEEPMRALGVPVTWVGQLQARSWRTRAIVQACRALRPQIIQSQHFYTNLYATLAARWLGAREIGAVRSSGFHDVRNTGRFMGWLSLNAPRLIAANSRKAVDYAVRQGRATERVAYLPNVIDTAQFTPSPRAASATLRLLTVGRLEAPKRFDRLLNLLAQFRARATRPFRLTIAGDGSLRTPLERQAQALGLLPAHVEFCGGVSDTAPLYRAADIFLLTSDYEGTPNVVLEAMAAGLPIISTNIGGVPEILAHNVTGLMFAPTDEAGFLAALNALSEDPARQNALGQAARRHIESHHSLTRLPEIFAELYARALL